MNLSRLNFGKAHGFSSTKNGLENAAHVNGSTASLKPSAGPVTLALVAG